MVCVAHGPALWAVGPWRHRACLAGRPAKQDQERSPQERRETQPFSGQPRSTEAATTLFLATQGSALQTRQWIAGPLFR